jgi:hypothetical protein
MLIVRKNQLNNLIATVSMNRTLQSPYYLFSFQHIVSKERISFIPEVVTTNTRYDKFRFIEGNPTNLSVTPPIAQFLYDGQYYYSIYEQLSPTNTNIALTYNKLESGRAVVIIGDDQTDECFFEPYISSNEDDANIIYLSEQEEICNEGVTPTPTASPFVTPSVTPTNTATPSETPTNTPTTTTTPSPTPTNTGTPTPTPTTPALPYNSFIVGTGSTSNQACNNLSLGNTIQVWANIGGGTGQCAPCLPLNCFACVDGDDTWWLDQSFTIPLPNMWLANYIADGGTTTPKRQHIVSQTIQGGSFTDC